jgi:hypothetical protein
MGGWIMFFGGFEFLLFPLVLIGLIVLGVVAVVAGRSEPDPDGTRSYAVYLVTITFVTLFAALFASFAVILSLLELATEPSAPDFGGFVEPGFEQFPTGGDPTDRAISNAVEAGIFAAAAGALLYFHATRLAALMGRPNLGQGGARRTILGYLFFTCFVAVLVALGAAVTAAIGLFEIIAPGTAGTERDLGLVKLVSSAALAAASGLIFLYHWRRAEDVRARLVTAPPPAPPPAP